jgi:hypothetical protein
MIGGYSLEMTAQDRHALEEAAHISARGTSAIENSQQ